MKIGDTAKIIRVEFDTKAYVDQFNVPHDGYRVIDGPVWVAVVEEKRVPGAMAVVYNNDHRERYLGFKAVDGHGTEFTVNWEQFNDETGQKMWRREGARFAQYVPFESLKQRGDQFWYAGRPVVTPYGEPFTNVSRIVQMDNPSFI